MWRRVVFADDLDDCPMCGEPFCHECDRHYANCHCPGPTMDDHEYELRDGVLYARQIDE